MRNLAPASGLGSLDSDFGFLFSGFGCLVSSFGFQVSGFGFRISGFVRSRLGPPGTKSPAPASGFGFGV